MKIKYQFMHILLVNIKKIDRKINSLKTTNHFYKPDAYPVANEVWCFNFLKVTSVLLYTHQLITSIQYQMPSMFLLIS